MLKVLFAISLTAIIFLVFFGIIRSIVQPKSTIRKRMASLETLDEANDPFAVPAYEAVSTAQSAEKTGGFAKTMEELASHLVPKGLRPIIQKRLVLAGKAREWSVAEFFGSCLLGALVMWLFATVLVRGGSWAPIQKTMIVFLLGILGGLMPVVFLNTTIDRRQKQIERQLPQVLDLLCVSVQAGLSFDAALAKITARMKGPFIDECRRLQEDIRMGVVRRTAMRALADRCGLEDVSLFMTSIIQPNVSAQVWARHSRTSRQHPRTPPSIRQSPGHESPRQDCLPTRPLYLPRHLRRHPRTEFALSVEELVSCPLRGK